MEKINKFLKDRVKGSKRIGVLGIGSEFRGDDAAGVMVAERLLKYFSSKKTKHNVRIFIGATAPENMTGEIRAFDPEHLIIIDSANMGKTVGAIALIEPGNIEGFSFCTHSLPLKTMSAYLADTVGCDITVIGIQPKTMRFGSKMSDKVRTSVKTLSDAIKDSLK